MREFLNYGMLTSLSRGQWIRERFLRIQGSRWPSTCRERPPETDPKVVEDLVSQVEEKRDERGPPTVPYAPAMGGMNETSASELTFSSNIT